MSALVTNRRGIPQSIRERQLFFECRREALLRVTSAMKDLGVSEAAPALCAFWNATWPTRSLGQTSATSDVAARKRGETYPLLVASVALLAQVAL